jgi:nicotinamide/nicotinate riboside kinase
MSTDPIPTRVITIGVGYVAQCGHLLSFADNRNFIVISGATSSGKTTLAKHLRNSLCNSFIIHQDVCRIPLDDSPSPNDGLVLISGLRTGMCTVDSLPCPSCYLILVQPAEKLPVDAEYGFEDWDDAPGAIDWDRMVAFLSDLKSTGTLPGDHQSFDSFNETATVPVDDEIIAEWKKRSEKLAAEHLEKYGEKLVWALIDGFLLYWDEVSLKCSIPLHIRD